MKLFDILKLKIPSLKPEDCKIHLAVWNGNEHPLEEFIQGRFQEWQNWQTNENFQRPYIVSLIKMDNKWLFAGLYKSLGLAAKSKKGSYYYNTEVVHDLESLNGRLVIEFQRPGRQSYLKAEKWTKDLNVSELKESRLSTEDFPGYTNVVLAKSKLDSIVKQHVPSWRAALGSVAGIYLITDTATGRHYVGSASGKGGFWERWCAYSILGHGNNKILKAILLKYGKEYSKNFQFAILETADTNTGPEQILQREIHWKNVLCSGEKYGGYNAN